MKNRMKKALALLVALVLTLSLLPAAVFAAEDVTVTLPELARPGAWYLCVNTFGDGNGRYFYEKGQEPRIEHDFCMRPRSVAIFTGRNY